MSEPVEPSRTGGRRVVALIGLAVAGAATAMIAVALESAGEAPLPASAASPWPRPEAPVDTALAHAGARLFRRSCAACHTLGAGRSAGPDLAGLLERREPAWIRGMVLSPDSMLRVDTVARALLARYHLPMPASNLSERELRAVIEHVRAPDAAGPR